MKFKVFIVSLFFVWSLLSGISFSQNKVVVVPLGIDLDKKSLRALCRGYDFIGEKPPGPFNCPPKMVFVTSEVYQGNLGGIEGADAECQELAEASDITKGRTFKAWISDNFTSPAESFIQSQTPYIRTNGDTVAENWDDLIDGNLSAAIFLDERSILATSTASVWTNTIYNGTPDDGKNCNNWTFYPVGITDGNTGYLSLTNSLWTDFGHQDCGEPARLYCFEQ